MRRKSRIPDLKAFVFNYGETVAACLAAGLVVAALGGTNWVPCDREPEALLQQIADARSRLDSAPWPASEQARFVLESRRPEALVASTLLAAVPIGDYVSSQAALKRPGAADRTLRLPILEPVQDLIVSHERVLVRLAPVLEPFPIQPHEREAGVGPTVDGSDLPDEFRRIRPTVATGIRAAPRASDLESGQHTIPRRGHGYPYAAVRGVFDLRANARTFQAAMHCRFADALRQIVIVDFQLERQELVRGPDRWSDWEPVDVQVFKDVAAAADGFEPDVVSAQVTDSAITAPLLSRITGVWRTQATHPRLAAFELSPEALAREMAFLTALVSRVAQQRKSSRTALVEKRGFTPLIRDARQLQQQLLAEHSADPLMPRRAPFGPASGLVQSPQPANQALEKLIRDVARELDPREQDHRLREWIRARTTAEGELLLFRYFDFDVEPGTTCRYRVRLELLNPNYGRSLSAAGGQADVVRTWTLLTPWSDPTPPVDVAENVQYFLTGIEGRPFGRFPLARMNVFQYDQELGTTVQQEIDVAFGQNIAGKARSEQFDPAQATIRVADYYFRSDDVLVDALPDLAFGSDLHPDLALPPHSRGAAQLVESALVVTDRRDLMALDRLSQAPDLALAQDRLERQGKLADEMVGSRDRLETSTGSDYEEIYGRLYGTPPSSGDAGQSRPGPNVLQRGRSR